MTTLTEEVKTDIKEFLTVCLEDFRKDAVEYDGLDLTVATSEQGDTWNYQTGDNSFTGGAYSLPHWAVTCVNPDSTVNDLYDAIVDQLSELLADC